VLNGQAWLAEVDLAIGFESGVDSTGRLLGDLDRLTTQSVAGEVGILLRDAETLLESNLLVE
jgi:hypothetical protein